MYMATVSNRGSPPAILLRVLKGVASAAGVAEAFKVTRSLQHGHVAAVLGTLRAGERYAIQPIFAAVGTSSN